MQPSNCSELVLLQKESSCLFFDDKLFLFSDLRVFLFLFVDSASTAFASLGKRNIVLLKNISDLLVWLSSNNYFAGVIFGCLVSCLDLLCNSIVVLNEICKCVGLNL